MTSETRPGRGHLVGSFLERRYRVDSLIARGGMSTVYRGLDTRLDRPVAIKVMDSQYSGDRSFIDRFEGEARAAARLHHPDVVAVYDQGVDREIDGDHVYLVMQLVEGATLRDLVRDRGLLPLPMALTVMTSVLSALAAAHQAGMVHRDIKPENVLIGHDGSVKVADFGLVRAAASAGTTSGSVILGTVAYLSPEQVTTGAADARTDVYAAGVLLYEMLTGTPPYTGDTALSVAYQHVNNDVPPPSDLVPELPPAIDDLVMRATRREEAARPDDAAVFLSELQRVRDHLGIRPLAVPVPETEARTSLIQMEGPQSDTGAYNSFSEEDHQPAGPRGTRAIARLEPEPEVERTQDFSAINDRVPPTAARPRDPRRRSRRTVAAWTVVVLVLAGLIGGAAWWMGTGRFIKVPQVEGKPIATAEQSLRQADLVPHITSEHSDTVAESVVISASPRGGSRVLSGKDVQLVVSLGRPKVPQIPVGTALEEAQSTLRNAKLQPKLDPSLDRYHPSIPEGQVLAISPGPGTPVPLSSSVTIVLSKGPQPVPVPNVGGMSRDDAFTALRQAGFDPYEAAKQFSADVEADHVISTDPAAGTEVKLTGRPRVGVVLSNAVAVPQFTGMRVQEAQQAAAAAGVNLDVQSFFQRPNSLVIGQFPLSGSKVQPGSVVHVTAF
jgi:serine/threonine-protein kinase